MITQIFLKIAEQLFKLLPIFCAYWKGKKDEKFNNIQKLAEQNAKTAQIAMRPNLDRNDILKLMRDGKL